MLRPGGTLAVFSYWIPTLLDQSQRFRDAFAKTLDNLVLKPVLSGNPSGWAMLAKVLEHRMTGKGALDSLPLPEDLYDDTLRVYINSITNETPYRAFSRQFSTANQELSGISRMNPRDQIVSYQSGMNPEAEGWS